MPHHPVQAIVTKYISPTATRPARIKASAAAGRTTICVDHTLNIEANHAKAAEALADKFGWGGDWLMGGMPDDTGYCFVCSPGAFAFKTLKWEK